MLKGPTSPGLLDAAVSPTSQYVQHAPWGPSNPETQEIWVPRLDYQPTSLNKTHLAAYNSVEQGYFVATGIFFY